VYWSGAIASRLSYMMFSFEFSSGKIHYFFRHFMSSYKLNFIVNRMIHETFVHVIWGSYAFLLQLLLSTRIKVEQLY
jgi:hypothetical protein